MGSVKLLGILNSAGSLEFIMHVISAITHLSCGYIFIFHVAIDSSAAYKNAHVPIIFIIGIVQMRKGSMRVALLVQLYHHLITVYLNLNISSCQRGVV